MSELRNTALWNIMETKAGEEGLPPGFATAVEKVCQEGIIKAKTIICFFPNFTLHDETHIMNVCEWMTRLLGNRANDLTACDAAMLLMAACCHDVGMSVTKDQEADLKQNTHTQQWDDYFNDNLDDWELYQKSGKISDKMLRNFVRLHHHERIGEQITEANWDRVLNDSGLQRQELIELCESHGKSLTKLVADDDLLCFDMRLCAVLLRLADILDFDPTRAPKTLFVHIGLDQPVDKESEKSQTEYKKNQAGKLIFRADGTILYSSVLDDPQLKKEVEGYIDWAEEELKESQRFLKQDHAWRTLKLPQVIHRKIHLSYCKAEPFQLTMDQERIIELLTGKNLYDDSCVFVRELLQNAVDAILLRREVDSEHFKPTDGKITITTWYDETGWGWFRIEDNGTGMDENIIQDYFLKVGRSYYDSDDFKREKKNHPRSTGYQPISRFGIGILSCFLSDENNQLQVSTRRYTDKSSGIRLHVTGRKGLYRLAVEGKQEKAVWQEMPAPDKDTHETYRTEPGTTICVGMNLFRLGDYRNIKEVVDKYVCFPDMQVTYRGPEVEKPYDYPTKSNFLGAVEQLKAAHGDTFPIVCRHPIPDEQFEKIKEWLPDSEWDAKPEIVLSYFPLDLFHNGNLCGMAVYPDIDWHVKKIRFLFQNVTYKLTIETGTHSVYFKSTAALRLAVDVGFPEDIEYKLRTLPPSVLHKAQNGKAVEEYKRIRFGMRFTIPPQTLVSAPEQDIIRYVDPDYYKGAIAYNGVVAGIKDGFSNAVLLLGGCYAPRVNVARDTVHDLPIEAAFELSCLERRINTSPQTKQQDVMRFSSVSSSRYRYMTEKEWGKLLDDHPEWKKELLDSFFDDRQLAEAMTISAPQKSLYGCALLAWLKRDYRIAYMGNEKLILSKKTTDGADTADFPASLFVALSSDRKLLGRIAYGKVREYKVSSGEFNYYSPDHPFSRWLIQNRAALQDELPDVYHKLLKWMVEGDSKAVIVNGINEQLKLLQQYCHNRFKINEELFLKESDLVDIDEDNWES